MNRVSNIGPAGRSGKAATKPGAGPGGAFSVAAGEMAAPEPMRETAAARGVVLSSMLALQEYETEAMRDKTARRHGASMLDALARLQNAMLSLGGEKLEDVANLRQLAAMSSDAADPGLAHVLGSIRLRAKIELLRRGLETG